MLLCFFVFYSSLSVQIFQSSGTQFYIGKEATISQNFSQNQKAGSAHIYIVKGTEVIGLHLDKNIAITYLEKPEKTKIHLAEKHFKQEKKVPKHMPNSEKATPNKETFKKSDSQKAFFFSAHHSTAVALSPTQNKKLLVHFPKEAKAVIMIKQSSRELVLEKNNFNIPSVCLTANSIHPPPFV